jgi:deoxyribodipyrimidine photo-lyase
VRIAHDVSLFIFRRDLRLNDNTALIEALKNSREVIPCFIFDPRQLDRNPFFSRFAAKFMVESLKELELELKSRGGKLYLFDGIAERVISQLITAKRIRSVFINRDYTPFSRKRDEKIAQICLRRKISCHVLKDALLTEPEEIATGSGKPYVVFSPFFKKASRIDVRKVTSNPYSNYYTQPIKLKSQANYHRLLNKKMQQAAVDGGRTNALKVL